MPEADDSLPAGAEVALWWLGQAGFLYKAAGVTALLDPFLAPHEGMYGFAVQTQDDRGMLTPPALTARRRINLAEVVDAGIGL